MAMTFADRSNLAKRCTIFAPTASAGVVGVAGALPERAGGPAIPTQLGAGGAMPGARPQA